MLADIVEKYANDEVLMQTAETVSCLFSNDSVATILDKHKTKVVWMSKLDKHIFEYSNTKLRLIFL